MNDQNSFWSKYHYLKRLNFCVVLLHAFDQNPMRYRTIFLSCLISLTIYTICLCSIRQMCLTLSSMLISYGCCNKSQTEWAKWQKFILPQFWTSNPQITVSAGPYSLLWKNHFLLEKICPLLFPGPRGSGVSELKVAPLQLLPQHASCLLLFSLNMTFDHLLDRW